MTSLLDVQSYCATSNNRGSLKTKKTFHMNLRVSRTIRDTLRNKKWHDNIPHKRDHFCSYEHNCSQGYSGEGYNRRTNYDHNALCHKHAKFGDRAVYCAAVDTCSMSPLRQQYDEKNEFLSSKQ